MANNKRYIPTEEEIRETIQLAISDMSKPAQLAQKALSQFVSAVNACQPLVNEFLSEFDAIFCNQTETYQTEGQTHLELDETTPESTGKSVSVDEVLANIDAALEADKESSDGKVQKR